MRHAPILALFLVSLATTVAACSSDAKDEAADAGAAPSCGFAYASWSPPSAPVSLKTDVMPIFQQSCGLSSSCHGDESGSAEGLYLGPPLKAGAPTDAQLAAVIASATADSTEAPTEKRIVAGNPSESWLMTKVDDAQACAGIKCVKPYDDCGTLMPQGGVPLDAAKRDVVRAWIAQGAKNN